MGTPAKVVRALSPEEIADIRTWADHYIALARCIRCILRRRSRGTH